MPYLLMIIKPPGHRAGRSQEEGEEAFAHMLRFADDLKARGVLLGVRPHWRAGARWPAPSAGRALFAACLKPANLLEVN